jgi:hypothetical protein
MQVIDAYITLLKAQEGLKKRQGGTVYLETACLTAVMKWDGEKKESIVDHYPKRGTSQRPGLVQRVLTYLDHDMVSIILNHLLVFHYQICMPDKLFIILI